MKIILHPAMSGQGKSSFYVQTPDIDVVKIRNGEWEVRLNGYCVLTVSSKPVAEERAAEIKSAYEGDKQT